MNTSSTVDPSPDPMPETGSLSRTSITVAAGRMGTVMGSYSLFEVIVA